MPAKAIAWPAALLTLFALSCGGTAGTSAPTSPVPKGETVEQRLSRLYDAAKPEGKLAFYSSLNTEDAKKILPKFEARFAGVKVDHTRASGEKLVQRVVTEKKAGQDLLDVMESNTFEVKFLIDQGYSQKYKVASWDDFRQETRDPAEGWVADRLNNDLPGINTTKIQPGAIKSWRDLCDSKYQGHIAVEQDDVVIYSSLKKLLGEQEAQRVIKCVAANKPTLRSGHTEMANLLAAGEFWVTLSSNGHRLAQLKYEDKAPVDWVRTDPVITDVQIMALADKAPHPNAARLFMEWLTSTEGQQAIADTGRVPASTKVKPKYPDLLTPGKPFYIGVDMAAAFNRDAEFWRTTFGIK